jgi:hypothetical protein
MRRLWTGVYLMLVLLPLMGATAWGAILATSSSAPSRQVVKVGSCRIALTSPAVRTVVHGRSFTLGKAAIGPRAARGRSGMAEALPLAAARAGKITSVSVFLRSQTTAHSLLAAVFSDRHGSPGAPLAWASKPSVRAGGWNTLRIPAVKVAAHSIHWIALLGRNGMLTLASSGSPCRSASATLASGTALPARWRTGELWSAAQVSAYVGGTLRAGGKASSGPGGTTTTGTTPTQPGGTGTAAPKNTAAPSIAGIAAEGATLSVNRGSWSGSPTSYSYQWQDCSTSRCTNISGAGAGTLKLGATDVGYTIDVVVTATNAGGSTSATSNRTAAIGPGSSGDVPTDCFAAPGACGYPDPGYGNVGATSDCSSLASSGGLNASKSGQVVQNLDIKGTLTISAPNVTVDNVCVTAAGDYEYNGIQLTGNTADTLIENTTVSGTSSSGTGVLNTGVMNGSNQTSITLNRVYITDASEDYHGAGTVENSYLQAGALFTVPSGTDGCSTGAGCESHNEAIYMTDTSVTLDHDTLLNSASQTAVLFGDNNGGSKGRPGDNHWILEDSLIAGGGYMAYMNAGATGVGSSTMTVEGNRFARCDGSTSYDGYGTTCNDATKTSGGTTGDRYGYYPNGGYYGGILYAYCPGSYSGQVWADNVWDDDNATVGCTGGP